MCVKLPPRDLNPNPYPLHSTNIYTFGVTIASKMCGGKNDKYLLLTKLYVYTD